MAITQDRKVLNESDSPHRPQSGRKANKEATTRIRRLFAGLEWRPVVLVAAMVTVTIFFGSLNRYYLSWAHFLDMGRQALCS